MESRLFSRIPLLPDFFPTVADTTGFFGIFLRAGAAAFLPAGAFFAVRTFFTGGLALLATAGFLVADALEAAATFFLVVALVCTFFAAGAFFFAVAVPALAGVFA